MYRDLWGAIPESKTLPPGAMRSNGMAGYDFTAIETKWQQYWEEHGTFVQPNPGDEGFTERPKLYVLDMFPYPSGAGLHVGHPEGYTATDIMCRYARMRGYNVLHPMGYDAFGLPAEQYAVEHGVHPRVTTEQNIANIERQIRMFGFSYDWSRRVATTDVPYYRWTQWIFLQLFHSWFDPAANAARPIAELIEKLQDGEYVLSPAGELVANPRVALDALAGPPVGTRKWHELSDEERRQILDDHRLAYQAEVPVNWCPKLGTVLANEEVTNEGRSERGDHPVYRRALRQWMLRITAYAERLLADIDTVEWPEPIKIMQRNWIGKSVGAEVDFPLDAIGDDTWFTERKSSGFPAVPEDEVIRVFTTRPDTLFGATYMVLAPEHPLVDRITTDDQRSAVKQYVAAAAQKSELERTADAKAKTGVFTGAHAINPVTRQPIPIWVADYVMMGYGTGAIMAVPAHDTRDFEFAQTFDLEIRTVVARDRKEYLLREQARQYDPIDFEGFLIIDPEHPPKAGWDRWAAEHNYRKETLEGLTVYAVPHHPRQPDPPKEFFDVEPEYVDFAHEAFLMKPGYRTLKDPPADVYVADGTAVNSGPYDGLLTPEFKKRITEDLATAGLGKRAVNYKLRDWLFSRQRYWGEPFPIIHCERCGVVAVPEKDLPLRLPEMEDFTPESSDDPAAPPRPPLGKAKEWARTSCPSCGGEGTRELNTMPQWAGSCWYYLRYLDPRNEQRFCDPEIERYWMGRSDRNPSGGVDLYVGGAEHAVLHLLYARFWHKVLFDLGHVSTPEPFGKLFNQGMIRSFAYRDARGVYLPYDKVDRTGEVPRHVETGEVLSETVEKMSKSLKNVVNPDEVIGQYGADTFRLYEMFMGPLEASKPWNTQDVPGVYRFLQRSWRMVVGDRDQASLVTDGSGSEEIEKALHRLIKKVGEDVEALKFNTAIAAMMEFVNAVYKAQALTRSQAERFVLLLAPFAPHLGEELWEAMGHDASLTYEPFPTYDEARLTEQTVEVAVQVNGKVRARIAVPADGDDDAILAAAREHDRIRGQLEGKTIVKQFVVKGKLVNFVVK